MPTDHPDATPNGLATAAPLFRAGLWMMGTLASFIGMAIGGRELAGELTTAQILFWRSVVGIVLVAALLSRFGWGQIRSGRVGLHAARNLSHLVGQFGWFSAIGLIPLAQVVAIEFTLPILVSILAMVFLGERMTATRGIAIACGFVGVLVIIRPGLVPISLGALMALMAAFGYAAAITMTKAIAARDSALCILFYMTVIQLPVAFLASLPGWTLPEPALWPWIVLVGVTALSAHYCITRAMMLADATVVVPMDFLRVPLIAIVGFLLYGEPLEFWVLAGAAIIFGGIYINLRAERRR